MDFESLKSALTSMPLKKANKWGSAMLKYEVTPVPIDATYWQASADQFPP
jgi:hypothetical protein